MEHNHYIFTDEKCEKILGKYEAKITKFSSKTFVAKAQIYKSDLQKKLGVVVIGWSHMGGNNADPINQTK